MKIFFNGTEYQIDDSVLQVAASRLKTYLLTDMFGSDATIDFDGESYGVDGAKLATATNSVEAYLRTIAGNDYNLVVNDVEYSVDGTKVASAISALEAILSGLSGDGGGGNTITWRTTEYEGLETVYYGNSPVMFKISNLTPTFDEFAGATFVVVDNNSGEEIIHTSLSEAIKYSDDVSIFDDMIWFIEKDNAAYYDIVLSKGTWVISDMTAADMTITISWDSGDADNTGDVLDNEWPIEWNTMAVVNNTGFIDPNANNNPSGVRMVKISDLIPTPEELESIEISANMNGTPYTFTFTNKYESNEEVFALYTCNELSMQTVLYPTSGTDLYPSGLYTFNFGYETMGAVNADCVAKLTTPSDDSLIHNTIAEGAYYANFNTGTFYNEMPETVSEGDAYLYGDYLYRYEPETGGWWPSLAEEWLSAYIPYEYVDRNQSSYDGVLATINNVPVTCLGLQNPDGPQYLLNPTFDDCINITSVGLPGSGASVEIPNSIIWLQGTFRSCTGLTAATIPNGVSNIEDAFSRCTGLISITFDGTIDKWNAISKNSTWNLDVPATYVQCSDGQVSLV